jgi:hypothetical protein
MRGLWKALSAHETLGKQGNGGYGVNNPRDANTAFEPIGKRLRVAVSSI